MYIYCGVGKVKNFRYEKKLVDMKMARKKRENIIYK